MKLNNTSQEENRYLLYLHGSYKYSEANFAETKEQNVSHTIDLHQFLHGLTTNGTLI